MTIGKVTKKDSRLFTRTYKFLQRNTNNLTLKDFAELIEFMNEVDETNSQASGPQASRPVLGMGGYLQHSARLNNQTSSGGTQRLPIPRVVLNRNNDLSNAAQTGKMKKQNNEDRNPLVPEDADQHVEVQ